MSVRTRWRRRLLALIPVAALGVLLSCGGSGGSDGGTGTTSACLEFTAAASAAAGTIVMTDSGVSTCDRAAVDLVVTDVADVFGARFTVSYDPGVADYDGYSAVGSFLSSDGASVEALAAEGADNVQFGITRLNPAAGIDAVGSELLVRLYFRRRTDFGTTALSFSATELDDDSPTPQPIPGLTWSSGTLTAR